MFRRLAELFCVFFRISLFVIGGGYSIIAVSDGVFAKRKWTEEGELLDHLPVFQMIPGLIATHTAVYVGRKRAGAAGAAVSVAAVALPAVGIFTLVSAGYASIPVGNPWLEAAFVGLRAALTGIIAATVWKSIRRLERSAFAWTLAAAATLALALGLASVAAVLLVAMAIGIVAAFANGAAETPHPPRVFRASWLPLLLFAKYGALCFGGGFVIVPMYLEDFVGTSAPWLQMAPDVFSNVMALSQMTPGPIGVNAATFFGYRLAGVAGALAASALLLLPGSLLAYCAFASLDRFRTSRVVKGLLRGVRPASLALMLVALTAFAKMTVVAADGRFNPVGAVLIVATTLLALRKKTNLILLILLSAAAGCLAAALRMM